MCGIVGSYSDTPSSSAFHLRKRNLSEALQALTHRGPDNQSVYWSKDATIGLGHSRLSIQDLSRDSDQPFVYRHLVITFNGEIYNFPELRQELEKKGYCFYTQGDTEVLAAAYMEWGTACFNFFNGMWAVAIWDGKRKQLTLSRDRFGVKPLFYSSTPSQFLFASEIEAIAHFSDLDGALNHAYVELSLQLGPITESLPETILKGVKNFPPGHYLQIQSIQNVGEPTQWWFEEENYHLVSDSYSERKDTFVELFQNALAIRCRSDASIGVALSGGLDSGSVACSMPSNFKAFTCDYKDGFSEADMASLIMSEVQGDHVLVPCESPSLMEMLACSINIGDVCPDSLIGLDLVYNQMQQEGIKVSIEGHGGDEILAGYRHHLHCRLFDITDIHEEPFSTLENLANFVTSPSRGSNLALLETMILMRSAPELRQLQLNGAFQKLCELAPEFNVFKKGELSRLKNRLSLDMRFNTLPAILRNFDRMSMRHGVEVRSPFLDWRLVTYCRSLPDSDLINQLYSKWILRDSIKSMPAEARLNKQKIGFVNPFITWCEKIQQREWHTLVELSAEISDHYFESKQLTDKLHAAATGRRFQDIKKSWSLLSTAVLHAIITRKISRNDLH